MQPVGFRLYTTVIEDEDDQGTLGGAATTESYKGGSSYTKDGSASLSPRAIVRKQSLVQVLPGGCSDPFGSQSITITAQINHLITLVRDSFLPGLYFTPFMRRFTYEAPKILTISQNPRTLGEPSAQRLGAAERQTVERRWRSRVDIQLRSDGGTIRDARRGRALYLLALKMRVRSLEMLQAKISSMLTDRQPDMSLILHIPWLFRADCTVRYRGCASVHAAVLRRLIEGVEDVIQQSSLLIILMFKGAELAVAKMERTLVVFQSWVPGKLTPFSWL